MDGWMDGWMDGRWSLEHSQILHDCPLRHGVHLMTLYYSANDSALCSSDYSERDDGMEMDDDTTNKNNAR